MHQSVPGTAVDTAVSTTRWRICFCGVEPASPFGELLAEAVSVPAMIVADGGVSAASGKWRGTVLGTALQWWAGGAAPSSVTPNEDAADVFIDFFGTEPAGTPPGRLWRLVDGTGEPILNPFCLVETCCRAPFVASIFLIERGTVDLGWTVLAEAHVGNCRRYRALLDRVAHIAAHLVGAALRKTRSGGEKTFCATPKTRRRSSARIEAQQLRARLARTAIVLRETALNEYWAIGVLNAPAESLLHSQALHSDRWIESPSRRTYFADPFPCPGRSDVIFCERYDYRTARGALRKLTLDDKTVIGEEPVDLRISDGHLSYPFPFPEQGRVFLLPEMGEFRKLVLFELVAQTELRVVCTVEEGARIADATLFRHGEFYWIAYCDQDFGTHDNLCLLYSRQLRRPVDVTPTQSG